MQQYDVEYVLSNDGMTLSLQGQGHSIRVTEIEKMAYFCEITGPRSLSVPAALCRVADSSWHFSKVNIQYFVES